MLELALVDRVDDGLVVVGAVHEEHEQLVVEPGVTQLPLAAVTRVALVLRRDELGPVVVAAVAEHDEVAGVTTVQLLHREQRRLADEARDTQSVPEKHTSFSQSCTTFSKIVCAERCL